MKQLRQYQQGAVASIWQYYIDGNKGNPIVAMPTGTGKSLTMAGFIKSVLDAYPDQHILSLTHVKELIKGNHAALLDLEPHAPAGIYSAGLKARQVRQVTFGGIMSVKGKAELFQRTNLILIDECHLVSENDATTYQRFIEELRGYNPSLRVIGFSATPFRMKSGRLTDGGLFTDVCCDLVTGPAFVWFIDQGYLAPVVPYRGEAQIDLSRVRIQAGEFQESSLESEIDRQCVLRRALDEALERAHDRRRWLVFAASIRHTEEAADYLNAHGRRAAAVHSKLPPGERDRRIAAYQAGALDTLTNKNILTTGFDAPATDCLIFLRPTRSPGLHVQMCGRGTRPVYAPGFDLSTLSGRLVAIQAGPKQDCLVLDFAGNTERLGPINYPVIPKPREKREQTIQAAPAKVCEVCGAIMHVSATECERCFTPFEVDDPPEPEFALSSAELIRRDDKLEKIIETLPVFSMTATVHHKIGKPPTLKVRYDCQPRIVYTYVAPEHPYSSTSRKAREWFKAHFPPWVDYVQTAEQMMGLFHLAVKPSHIQVWTNTKYPEVISYGKPANMVSTGII